MAPFACLCKTSEILRLYETVQENWEELEDYGAWLRTPVNLNAWEVDRGRGNHEVLKMIPQKDRSRVIAKYTIKMKETNEEKMHCLLQRCLNNVISSRLMQAAFLIVTWTKLSIMKKVMRSCLTILCMLIQYKLELLRVCSDNK